MHDKAGCQALRKGYQIWQEAAKEVGGGGAGDGIGSVPLHQRDGRTYARRGDQDTCHDWVPDGPEDRPADERRVVPKRQQIVDGRVQREGVGHGGSEVHGKNQQGDEAGKKPEEELHSPFCMA